MDAACADCASARRLGCAFDAAFFAASPDAPRATLAAQAAWLRDRRVLQEALAPLRWRGGAARAEALPLLASLLRSALAPPPRDFTAAAAAHVAAYLTLPLRTRVFDDPDVKHTRAASDSPTQPQQAVIDAIAPDVAIRSTLDDADTGVWNAQQDIEAVAARTADAEEGAAAGKLGVWVAAQRAAQMWLDAPDEDGNGGAGGGGEFDKDASPRPRRGSGGARRLASQPLLDGGVSSGGFELRGTPALREAVSNLRRSLCHPSLAASLLASVSSKSHQAAPTTFAGVLSSARASVQSLTLLASSTAAKAATAGPKSAAASAAAHAAGRLRSAQLHLSFQLRCVDELKAGENKLCPICLGDCATEVADKLVVAIPCGHLACRDCLTRWLRSIDNPGRVCQECRTPVAAMESRDTARAAAAADARLAASGAAAAAAAVVTHGTKLSWLLAEVAQCRAAPGGSSFRAIVFSQFEEVLDVVSAALQAAGVRSSRGYGPDAAAGVEAFKAGALPPPARKAPPPPPPPVVLLLALRGAVRSAAAGVNLTEASVAYLFEPTTDQGLEAQAVARLARLGQTRPVTVVRLVLRGTLEEDVLRMREAAAAGSRGGAGSIGTGDEVRCSRMKAGLTAVLTRAPARYWKGPGGIAELARNSGPAPQRRRACGWSMRGGGNARRGREWGRYWVREWWRSERVIQSRTA